MALSLGGAVVSVIRFICHFISGITIWKSYCPEGMVVELYSFIYNGSYMVIELVLTVIGSMAIGKLFNLRKNNLA